MRGIDTLNGKLVAYSRALKGVIPDSCKWLIIRDTDCVPCTRKESAGNDDKKDMDTSADVKVLFQDGYGIESTFAAEPRKLARILGRYYLLDDSVHTTIETYISETSSDFSRRVRDITDTELYGEFENHFNRQIKNRSGRTYRSLQFRDVLAVISSNNIQYIMTKGIMNKYLKAIHDKIVIEFPQTASMTPLDIDSIFTEYYSHINTVDDLLDCHKTILDEIYTYTDTFHMHVFLPADGKCFHGRSPQTHFCLCLMDGYDRSSFFHCCPDHCTGNRIPYQTSPPSISCSMI